MKPDIEQFKKTLFGGKGEYVPIAELGVHPKVKEKFIGHEITSLKDEVEFWFKAGYDYVKLQPDADFNPSKIGVSDKKEIQSDRGFAFNWANENEGVISNEKDLEEFVFPIRSDFGYSKFDEVRNVLPNGMGVVGQYGDIFTMTWEMMGFEKFSFALFENPDLIKKLNDKLGDLVLSMFEYFAQHDSVDVLWYSDDIAYTNGLLMSPDVLDEYFFPWLKKIGDLAKEYNKPLIYHTDGILYDVMDKIISCGVNALHPIEPKAMELKVVKEKYGDKLSLIGSIDVDLLCRGTKEEIISKVKCNIETAGYNGGYCVGSGNSIPEYVNFENFVTMLNAAKEFGQF
jgi:uroporphyrinogen decarboxylase